MPEFYLSQDNISRLQHKFNLFNKERRIIHELLINYEADYRQFKGNAKARREFLREKYLAKAPNMSHLILNNNEVLWSMDDISILLGRNLSTIMRTFNKLESSSDYYSRLLALRECVKAKNGHDIFVYHKEIFDLIIDLYEDEYLLRFAKPRRGDINNAPDFKEVKKFWQYLKEQNNFNKNNLISVTMPDISAMNLKDILALIWHKVFNIKTGTVCSVIFAVCFELTRRFFGVNLWLASIPFTIFIICIILIKFKISRADFLSDLGAGALLFALLWISGSLSVSEIKQVKQELSLKPAYLLNDDRIYFEIAATNYKDIKELFYRASPDLEFHSTVTINNVGRVPNYHFYSSQSSGSAEFEIKYLNLNNQHSKVWKFNFDIARERFELKKQNTLKLNNPWVTARCIMAEMDFIMIDISMLTFSRGILKSIIYGINTEPNIKLDASEIDYIYNEILSQPTGKIKYVTSYLIFTDGSSSDIRTCELINYAR